jgi:predicted RNA binding protein YcfA (HicA-like mRNA interferase family)
MALKPTSPNKVIKALIKLGFKIVRQKGSHTVLKHSDGRITVVPIHPGEEIGRGLLAKIIRDTGLSKEEFLRTLEEV